MKRYLLLTLFCTMVSQAAYGQLVTNPFFTEVTSSTCPFDSTQTVHWPQGWRAYQTTDGRWDGPVDSSRCLSFRMEANGFMALDQIDLSLPLFVSTEAFLNDGLLMPDWVYGIGSGVLSPSPLLNGVDCPGGICSGLIYRVDVPAETLGERDFRTYIAPFGEMQFYDYDGCLVTERFAEQYLERLVIKLTFDDLDAPQDDLRLYYADVINSSGFGPPRVFEGIVMPEFTYDGQAYAAPIEDVVEDAFWASVLIGRYPDTTYPSEDNIRYIEVSIASDPPTQQVINLYINEYTALHFQLFTMIRPGKVAGSDSLRHVLNITSGGGSWCFSSFAELVFDGNTHFVYDGGQLDFNGEQSCLMFLDGSELRVADGQTLHYGQNGLGILGIGRGSRAVLGRNSKLHINNQMLLWNHEVSAGNQAYLDLQPGNELVFGPQARLERLGIQEEGIYLNVYMNGGRLDDSALSAEERRLIRRIYPEPALDMADDFHIFPNPVGEDLQWSYVSPEAGEVHWAFYNALGQRVQQGTVAVDRGRNLLSLPCKLPSGTYFLALRADRGRAVRAFVK